MFQKRGKREGVSLYINIYIHIDTTLWYFIHLVIVANQFIPFICFALLVLDLTALQLVEEVGVGIVYLIVRNRSSIAYDL